MKILEAASEKKLQRLREAQARQHNADKTDAKVIEQIESLLHNATHHQTSISDKELVEAHEKLHRKAPPPMTP